MAEELGSAVLRLTVKDELTDSLRAAKQQLDEFARQAGTVGDNLAKLFGRTYRLNINDSQLVAANTRLKNLDTKLKEITSKPFNVRLNIIEGGLGAGGKEVSRQSIAERFKQAAAGGLSGELASILAGDVGATRTSELRSTLLSRLSRGSLGSGGYNVPGLKEFITQLGGTPSGKREQLVAQARELAQSVSDAIINKVGQDLLDLKLQLGAEGAGEGGGPPRGRDPRLAQEAAIGKLVDLQTRLNVLSAKGVDLAQARDRLARATAAVSSGDLRTGRLLSAQLDNQIRQQEGLLRVESARRQQAKAQGGLGFAETPEQILASRGGQRKGAAESIDAVNRLLDQRLAIEKRINSLEAQGVDVTNARKRIAASINALNEGNLGTARQNLDILNREAKAAENRLRFEKESAKPAQQLAARGGQQKGGAESIDAVNRLLDRRVGLEGRIGVLEAKGIDVAAKKAQLDRVSASINEGNLGTANQILSTLTRQVRQAENALKIDNARAAAAKKLAAETKIPGLPPPLPGAAARGNIFQRLGLPTPDFAGRREDVLSNALIGGAFPLLFGQGIGAAAGGAAGGALGGAIGGQFGFGLSLAGTAVGAQFDAITQKSVALGQALGDPIGRFSEIQQNALLSSRSLEKQVEALISVGREAEAAALIQQDLARSYGGAAAARELAAAQDQLGRSWASLNLNIAQISLPPIAAAASSAADALTLLLEPLRQIRTVSAEAGGAGGPAPAPTATGQAAGALREGARGLVPTIPGLPLGLPIIQGFLSQAAKLIQAPEPTAGAVGTQQEEKRTKLLEAQKKLITEQIRGRASLVKQAELEVLEIEQQIKLDAIRATTTDKKAQAIQVDAAQREFELRRFELEAQKDDAVRREAVDSAALAARAERADRERAAAATILRAQQEGTADALARQLSNAQELATAGASSARSAIAQRQAVLETVAAAQGRYQQASAEYDAARIVGDEPAIDAALARQRQAAGEIQLSIVTGAETFARTIEQARNNIRSTLEGSYRLLRPEIQQKLLADARQRIDFSLFSKGRVRSPSDVFAAASASESISQQRALISESTQGFAQLSAQLGEGSPVVRALTDLNNKDWLVQVNVAADGTSSSYGDVVAGAIQ